jgi:hypothetical protein
MRLEELQCDLQEHEVHQNFSYEKENSKWKTNFYAPTMYIKCSKWIKCVITKSSLNALLHLILKTWWNGWYYGVFIQLLLLECQQSAWH